MRFELVLLQAKFQILMLFRLRLFASQWLQEGSNCKFFFILTDYLTHEVLKFNRLDELEVWKFTGLPRLQLGC